MSHSHDHETRALQAPDHETRALQAPEEHGQARPRAGRKRPQWAVECTVHYAQDQLAGLVAQTRSAAVPPPVRPAEPAPTRVVVPPTVVMKSPTFNPAAAARALPGGGRARRLVPLALCAATVLTATAAYVYTVPRNAPSRNEASEPARVADPPRATASASAAARQLGATAEAPQGGTTSSTTTHVPAAAKRDRPAYAPTAGATQASTVLATAALAAGDYATARVHYFALQRRYPSDPAFALVVEVLDRHLRERCRTRDQAGEKGECP